MVVHSTTNTMLLSLDQERILLFINIKKKGKVFSLGVRELARIPWTAWEQEKEMAT